MYVCMYVSLNVTFCCMFICGCEQRIVCAKEIRV